MRKMYTVYIIRSKKSGRRYIGYTEDIAKRLKQHNDGINVSTKNKGPWEVIYREDNFESRKTAQQREQELKRMKGGVQLKNLLKQAGIV